MSAENNQREELADILMSDEVMFVNAFGRNYALVEADAILAAGYRKVEPVTDEMVEAAARVFYASQTGHDDLATSGYRDAWLRMARRALEAALSVNPKTTNQNRSE